MVLQLPQPKHNECLLDIIQNHVIILYYYRFRDHNWFWIPIVGAHLGAIIGAIFYQFLIGFHMPEEDEYEVYRMNGE